MTEGDGEVERALAAARRVEPSWTAGRQQQLKWALMARLDEPRRPVALGMALASAAVVVALGGIAWHELSRRTAVRLAAGSDARFALARPLADGSSIVLDEPAAILKTLRESSDEVVVQLDKGGAHFDVARRPSRIFRVQAGPVTVQVIGTRFHVRRDGERTRISVDRGRVLASWWGGSRELGAGEQGMFPPEGVAAQVPAMDAPETVAPRANAEEEPARARVADRARGRRPPRAVRCGGARRRGSDARGAVRARRPCPRDRTAASRGGAPARDCRLLSPRSPRADGGVHRGASVPGVAGPPAPGGRGIRACARAGQRRPAGRGRARTSGRGAARRG